MGAFPDAQFLHYNIPRAGRILQPEHYARLVPQVPNLVATKNTLGGLPMAAGLMRHAPQLQHFFGETNFPHGCMYGECSLLATKGPLTPHKAHALFEAGRRRDLDSLFQLQHGFHDLGVDLFAHLYGEGRMDGAYDKIVVRLGGFEEMPLRLLSPYKGFTEAQYQACKETLHRKYPDWVAKEAQASGVAGA